MLNKGIFKDIEKFIFTPDIFLNIQDDHKKIIQNFLNEKTAESARTLFNFIQNIHKKECIFSLMDDLRLYEEGFLHIIPDHREHFFHSASVYVLGLAIYNSCKPFRDVLTTDRHPLEDNYMQKSSFLFRWSLAACLHDLAYPLEISLKSFNKYSLKLHELKQDQKQSFVNIHKDIYERFNFLPIISPQKRLEKVQKDTAIGLIVNELTRRGNSRVSYETLFSLIHGYLCSNLEDGRVDHGVISALILLKRVHELYEKKPDLSVEDYYYEVVDSATAIFLHNTYRYSNFLKDIFGNGKYRYDYPSPLGYLLYLTDSFCEFMRMGTDDSDLFSLKISDKQIEFIVDERYKNSINKARKLFDERLRIKIKYIYRSNE